MTDPKFEELLDHCIRQAERHAQAGGFISRDIFDAARLALVAYFEERAHSERQAVAAMLYLGGRLATKDKLSPAWIQEAIKATAATVGEVPR
jgi:hypothetical protein